MTQETTSLKTIPNPVYETLSGVIASLHAGLPALSWDDYFLLLCQVVALKSKDPSSKFGAVIVGPGHEVRSLGYNGFPRGVYEQLSPEEERVTHCTAQQVEARWERPEKYLWCEHAERNAIYNAARHGTPLQGCTIYVSGFPCADCARAIIQAGIADLIFRNPQGDYAARWNESLERARTMLLEAGVTVFQLP
jgi:dCMP deaminase